METLRIEIINPKAKKLLQELANLQLINIKPTVKNDTFEKLLKDIRDKKDAPPLDEITREVEAVRSKRYADKTK